MREVFFLLAFLTPQLCSCVPVCDTKETRCNGSLVEVCDSNGQWQQVMNCAEVIGGDGAAWSCCPAREGDAGLVHACLPADECTGGDR
jgi:hypothetical protein